MRCLPGLVLLMLTATSLTATAQTATSAPKHRVYLTGMALEELKTTRPKHYAKAVKVMEEMSKPCPEGEWQVSWAVEEHFLS